MSAMSSSGKNIYIHVELRATKNFVTIEIGTGKPNNHVSHANKTPGTASGWMGITTARWQADSHNNDIALCVNGQTGEQLVTHYLSFLA